MAATLLWGAGELGGVAGRVIGAQNGSILKQYCQKYKEWSRNGVEME